MNSLSHFDDTNFLHFSAFPSSCVFLTSRLSYFGLKPVQSPYMTYAGIQMWQVIRLNSCLEGPDLGATPGPQHPLAASLAFLLDFIPNNAVAN